MKLNKREEHLDKRKVAAMSQKTRREIRRARLRARRAKRAKFLRRAPGYWTEDTITSGGFLAACLIIAFATGLFGGTSALILLPLVGFLAPPLVVSLLNRLLDGWYLIRQKEYNFYKLQLHILDKRGAPEDACRRLRDLCEVATLQYLELQEAGVEMTSPPVQEAMRRRYDEAKQLADAIAEFHRNRPEDPKVVAKRLKQKLEDQERAAKRDAVTAAALDALRAENNLEAKKAELGGHTLTDDIVVELTATSEANTEVKALQPDL